MAFGNGKSERPNSTIDPLLDGKLLSKSGLPKHVAIIMDGNGRWAKARYLPRVEGHRAGAKTVREIVTESRKLGIKYLTLFAFSTENWYRPGEEVSALMKLFLHYLESEADTLAKNDIQLIVIGDKSKLPQSVLAAMERCCKKTEHCTAMRLVLAISYGSRNEIANAAKIIAAECVKGNLKVDDINEVLFSDYLYTKEIPDPDLLIRTSGETRISNFLLWQLAYSEIVVSQVLWPDFDVDEYKKCLNEFSNRTRRFGLTEEQIENGQITSGESTVELNQGK
jgi:undecaprenyl diphosphate synthase